MKDRMKTIGESFRQRRKELNLSFKEVENATSIRINFLQAIEEGELGKLISPVYAQGFIKQYGAFLGLDGEKIIREHSEVFAKPGSQEFTYGLGSVEMRGHPTGGIKWFPNALWILAFVALLVLAWYFGRFLEVF